MHNIYYSHWHYFLIHVQNCLAFITEKECQAWYSIDITVLLSQLGWKESNMVSASQWISTCQHNLQLHWFNSEILDYAAHGYSPRCRYYITNCSYNRSFHQPSRLINFSFCYCLVKSDSLANLFNDGRWSCWLQIGYIFYFIPGKAIWIHCSIQSMLCTSFLLCSAASRQQMFSSIPHRLNTNFAFLTH